MTAKKGHGAGGYLMGSLLVSALAAFIAVRFFDFFFQSTQSKASSVARTGVFMGAWTAITSALGLRWFSERIQRWRHK